MEHKDHKQMEMRQNHGNHYNLLSVWTCLPMNLLHYGQIS